MLIRQLSTIYNTRFVNTHSYLRFIIMTINNILKYHWYRLSKKSNKKFM